MAANTPNRAYTYPQSTDNPDVPADMQELATDIDTDVAAVVASIPTQVAAARSHYVLKTDTQTTISNTTHVNDTMLVASLAANKIYRVECLILFGGAAAADFKLLWDLTSCTMIGQRICIGPSVASTSHADTNGYYVSKAANASAVVGTDGTNIGYLHDIGVVETTTSGATGTIQIKWAQNTSTASNNTVYPGSMIIITEITPA